MDECEGRRAAEGRAARVTSALRVLERAAQQEVVDLPSSLTGILATRFYAPANLVRDRLARDADWKSPSLT